MSATTPSARSYDVAIVGGALAGAATALLLLRQEPRLRVLIIEKSDAFTRRVGEATVEISGYFLTRLLGLTQHLNEAHLVKQGMRFWFFNSRTRSLAECSEFGGGYLSRVPAFQVDRAVLDEELLRQACVAGAELCRPATVSKIELHPGGQQLVTVRQGEETRTVLARWLVDASGVAAVLARQQGWWRLNQAHPTAAAWARWRGVKDWDGFELADKYPDWSKACYGMRNTATNHLAGDGWWAWCIPLKGGDVSVGVVIDQRLVQWPAGGTLGQRLKDFLCQHPAGKELLADAQWIEGDVHWRRNLAYYTTTYAGDGFALVGDASAFMDPLYSPGMDWVAFTVSCTVDLILKHRRGEALAPLLERLNANLRRSYERWAEAVYHGKYEYIGEYDLMRVAFMMDLGLYYLGVASQPFKYGMAGLLAPVFATRPSIPFYYLMRTYNRRFARLAQARRARKALHRANHGRRFMFAGYTFSPVSARHIVRGLLHWAWLELSEGWRSWFSPRRVAGSALHGTADAPVSDSVMTNAANR